MVSQIAFRCGNTGRIVTIRRGLLAGHGGPQPILLDPPVPVLLAVDQDYRDPVRVLVAPIPVGVDIELVVGEAELVAQAQQHRLGLLAQVAAHPGDQRYVVIHFGIPPLASPGRSRHFITLPVTVCGSSSTTRTSRGSLNLASDRDAAATSCSGSSAAPSAGTTYATTASPVFG